MPLYLYIFIKSYPKRCTHVQVVTWQAWELMMHDALVFLQVLGTVARVQRNRIFLICHRHAVLGNCSIVNCWPFISADSHHKMWLRSRCEETPSVDISGDISWQQQCMVTCSVASRNLGDWSLLSSSPVSPVPVRCWARDNNIRLIMNDLNSNWNIETLELLQTGDESSGIVDFIFMYLELKRSVSIYLNPSLVM